MSRPPEPSLLSEIERDLLDRAPVADVLRKLIILGGRAGSGELTAWARHELRGYAEVALADLPAYRMIGAVIQVDAVVGNTQISHMSISPSQLPEEARGHITNEAPFVQGIGEIEAIAAAGTDEGSAVRIALPRERSLAQMMDASSPNRPYQQTNAIYWSVSRTAVLGLVDQVRTRLAELLSELRSTMPPSAETPTSAQAAHAVSVVINGNEGHVNVSQAGGASSASVSGMTKSDGPFWTLGKRVGATIVGLASIAAAVIAWLQLEASG